MARSKIIPDTAVFAALRHLMVTEGPAAASFRAIGRATGLAPATLVQRYGSAEKMLVAALCDGWDQADAALLAAADDAPKSEKGAAALLKALPAPPPLVDHPVLQERAEQWRRRVISELSPRVGGGQAAAMLFAAWQGRLMWDKAGARGFSLRDLVRKLT
ncbi:MAG: transcriptional regulator [Paracoccaceae bacterium]